MLYRGKEEIHSEIKSPTNISLVMLVLHVKLGGARGVMVIIIGMVTRVQILDETDFISHNTNTLGKGMNPIILPPAMGKW